MAGLNRYYPGVSSVGQYQMSGEPYATSSLVVSPSAATEIKFPAVTKFFTVVNTHSGSSSPLRVGFSQNGVAGSNYFVLDNGESYTGELRVRYLYLLGDFAGTTGSIIAGITGIESELSGVSGYNYSGSQGVG